ncbi:MAG: hypothetical protein L6Q38_13165, partial [Nitrospira sp.]|nr:hypothetical protein [Nitrospira sp.]
MAVYKDCRNQKIRFQYTDWKGQRRTCTPPDGTTWAEAQRMFREVQSRHDLIRRGIEPEPREPEQVPVQEALIEYIRLGKQRGMNQKKVRPWSPKHIAQQERMQKWVLDSFGVRFVYELDRQKIEKELDRRHAGGVEAGGEHGKTSNNYASALHTFLTWCVSRGYIDADPMQHWTPYDETPSFIRRAPTVEEVQKVLAVVPEERRLLYQVAICSGLRAGELRQLLVKHLTDEGIDLPGPIAKNRKATLQPLPAWLVGALRKASEAKFGMHKLLHVPKEA